MKYVHVIPRFIQFGVCFQCRDMNSNTPPPPSGIQTPPGFPPPPTAPPLIECKLCGSKFDTSQTRKTSIVYHLHACYGKIATYRGFWYLLRVEDSWIHYMCCIIFTGIQFRNAVSKFGLICWKCGKVCQKVNVRVSCFLHTTIVYYN